MVRFRIPIAVVFFVAIGSERYRGNNGTALGFLNGGASSNKRVQFKARLWDFKLPTAVGAQPPTLAFYVYAISNWGNKPRGLFITLAHWNIDNSQSNGTFEAQYEWNWPMQESFYHPGVEWAFVDAEDVAYYCSGYSVPRLTTINQEISYDINLQTLFQCISNWNGWDTPMPSSGAIPIHGVHWSVEMSGTDGWIWPSVHEMKMVQ